MQRPAEDSKTGADTPNARLVRDLADFLDRWQLALARRAPPEDPVVALLQHQALELAARSTSVGFGGIGHHLGRCHQAVQARNLPELSDSLAVLGDLKNQASAELVLAVQSGARFRAEGSPSSGASVEPPRMVTSIPNEQRALPSPPPPLLGDVPRADMPRGDAFAPTLFSAPGGRYVDRRSSPPDASSSAAAPPVVASPSPQQDPPPLVALHFPSEPPAAVAMPPPVAPMMPAVPAAGEAGPAGAGDKPQLLVRSMFGLRAFGREKKPSVPPVEGDGAASLLGLKSRRRSEPALSAVQPPLLSNDPSGLPRLADAPPGQPPAPLPQAAVGQVLDRFGARQRPSHARASRPGPRQRASSRTPTRGRGGTGAGWIAFGAATVGIGVLVMVGVLLFGRRPAPEPAQSLELASAAPAPSSASEQTALHLPRSKLSAPGEQLNSLMVQIHGRKLSPELRAYIDEDAASVAKALTKDCKNQASSELCTELTETFVDQKPLQIKKRQRDPNRPRAGWLRGLKMPSIPVEDDERVKRQFEFYTENPVGRETFQAMLFRCGAYKDLIHSELVKYELPTDVMAVVFAESSCFIRAESPAGAVGLWQFIPAAARAYHLRVQEGVVDERLSPVKSTLAGVRYMADMYALFGEWDLVFASYNMGPFGLMARLERAGGDAGFWDLVDAKLLPEETGNYAPAIQALALVMNNLSRLKFSTSQLRAPQLTADLEPPAGTRLGMVARAAAMSSAELRKLNPDIVGENVPNLPGGFSVQVPKDVVWQARDTLKELLAQRDDADLCVSPAFDWGKRQFTTSMAEACYRKLKARDPSATAVAADAPAADAPADGTSSDAPGE